MNPFWDVARSVEQDDTMGIRVFDSLDVEENWPTANWGMEFEQPEWLKDVHNKYVGERCFLMGTGPSLIEQLPLLEQMKTEYTFSCNRMKMFQGLPFTPWISSKISWLALIIVAFCRSLLTNKGTSASSLTMI